MSRNINCVQQLCIVFLVCVHVQAILNINNNSSRIRQKPFMEEVMDVTPSIDIEATNSPQPPTDSVLESIRLKCTLSIDNGNSSENCASICDAGINLNITSHDDGLMEKVTNDLFTQCPNIETLSVNDNPHLTNISGALFEQFFALQQLNLSQNRIKEIPSDAFRGAHALTLINLSSNAIESVAGDAFKRLAKLLILDLSANRIKQLSAKMLQDCTSLTHLILRRNSLPQVEMHFTTRVMQLIDMSSNELSAVTFKTPAPKKQQNAYPRNFSNVTLLLDDNLLKNLTISPAIQIYDLSLARNQLDSITELSKIRPFLARNLNLEGNSLTYLDSKQLPVSSKLEILRLRGNKLSDLEVEELKSHFLNLNFVSLQENEWTCKDLKRIVTQLQVRNVKILDADDEKEIPARNPECSWRALFRFATRAVPAENGVYRKTKQNYAN
ncbi:slit homolog 3 protein-like [Culicoides brevitarsis]|uniref:slit homolog 3 protein-like n=1 Tax=Culicoides brevitarsis TaxID=469753 RepID=UPI00307B523A